MRATQAERQAENSTSEHTELRLVVESDLSDDDVQTIDDHLGEALKDESYSLSRTGVGGRP